MKLRAIVPIVALLFLGGLWGASAENLLSLPEARVAALSQSKTLQEALASVESARLDEKLHAYTLLPSITATAAGTTVLPASSFASSSSASAGLSVKQTLFDGTYSVLAAIDAISTSAAQAAAREEYFNVLDDVDTAYYDAAKAAASLKAAQSDLTSAQANRAVTEAKYQAGMLSTVDLMKQQATVASSEATLVAAQGTLNVAMRSLSSLTGVALPVTLAPVDTSSSEALMQRIANLSDAQTRMFVENISVSASKNNPSLLAANLAVEKAQKNIKLASAGYLPSVSVSLSGVAGTSGSLQSSATLTVSVPLDPWNVGTTVESKKVAANVASLALAESERAKDVSIEQAVSDTVAAAKSVAASQQALEYAQRYEESIQAQYRLATVSSADLSDAAQLVSTDRASLISARYQFLADLSSLRTLAGVEEDGLLAKLVP